MSLELYFPALSGGIEQGLNDAGIETFEGEFQRHIVRECTQNALDAMAGEQVRVDIQLRQVRAAQIPGMSGLREAVESARVYWNGDIKTDAFCRKALERTSGTNVTVLEVSDYGTKGLEGADGDRRGSWFGLVQSGGVSIKAGDAAGAFGIGKDAPFAGSFVRTVFYSSQNQQGECAFQGVAKLTTHLDRDRRKTQPTGFIGRVIAGNGECRSVRDAAQIPEPFRRQEAGTSLFLIAYRQLGHEDWTHEYIRQAIENFWPAIHRGSLVFQIGEHRLDTSTLPVWMSRYSGDSEFISRFYFYAVTNGSRLERNKVLPHLGQCHISLVSGDATYPKKVCMTRQTGMKIYEAARFRSYRPFAGLFICESSVGNAYLRQLEPPRHDTWDASRAEDAAQAKNVLKCIRDWINECLIELNPDEDVQEADVPELNRYLPDEEDEPLAEESSTATERRGEDGLITAPLTQSLLIQEVPPRSPTAKAVGNSDTLGDGAEGGNGSGDGNPDPDDGPAEEPDGESNTAGGGATSQSQTQSTKILLQTRSVRVSPNTYEIIVRSAASCAGRLILVSVGEDNREDRDLGVTSIRDVRDGNDVAADRFALNAGEAARLQVTIASAIPISLRAYCHGN